MSTERKDQAIRRECRGGSRGSLSPKIPMKTILASLTVAVLPLTAQLLVPDFRGAEESSHAEWDVFTEGKFAPNLPDVASDPDATITSVTGSAFIISSGNLYSFQAPVAVQLDDATDLTVRNVFLQVATLGSGLDRQGSKLLVEDGEGEVPTILPRLSLFAVMWVQNR